MDIPGCSCDADRERAILFGGFLHGSNKMHGWCEPEWPWACTACWAKAEELQSSAIVCAEFMHMVLLGMFDAAGGYRHVYVYIDNFEAHWWHHQPEQLLHAASLSLYPPDMAAIKDWCKHQYPALAYILWTPRTIGRYACSSQALDTLD